MKRVAIFLLPALILGTVAYGTASNSTLHELTAGQVTAKLNAAAAKIAEIAARKIICL